MKQPLDFIRTHKKKTGDFLGGNYLIFLQNMRIYLKKAIVESLWFQVFEGKKEIRIKESPVPGISKPSKRHWAS
jgi:hypothetical protein